MDIRKTVESTIEKIHVRLIGAWRQHLLAGRLRDRDQVWIHYGCGEINDSRFMNVDARLFPHIHLVTRWPDLSFFRPNSVDLIYACHVFEHFSFLQQEHVLRCWARVLKPGGCLRLSVPDFDKIVKLYLQNDNSVAAAQPFLMGGQDYEGNFHSAIFNKGHLTSLLESAGFASVSEWHPSTVSTNWPKDHSWEDWISLNLEAWKK